MTDRDAAFRQQIPNVPQAEYDAVAGLNSITKNRA